MSAKKILTVFGATGAQGGSVIRSVLGDPKAASQFGIRAVTRDVSKPSAKALQEKGCEVVAADMNDRESLSAALKGSYAVYAVTNYWEKMDAELEEQQGRTLAELAKEHNIQHYIWSTLNDISKLSNGALPHVYHFDFKAHVNSYLTSLGVPTTFYYPGLYMSNFPTSLRKTPSGSYQLTLPIPASTTMPLLATETDTGKFIKAILLHRDETLGKHIYGAQRYYSVEEVLATFSAVTGKKAELNQVSDEVFRGILGQGGMPVKIQQELVENWKLNVSPGYLGGDSLEASLALLDEELVDLKTFFEGSAKVREAMQ